MTGCIVNTTKKILILQKTILLILQEHLVSSVTTKFFCNKNNKYCSKFIVNITKTFGYFRDNKIFLQ